MAQIIMDAAGLIPFSIRMNNASFSLESILFERLVHKLPNKNEVYFTNLCDRKH